MDKKKLLVLLIAIALIIGIVFGVFYFLGERAIQDGELNPNNPFPINTDTGFGSFPGDTTSEDINEQETPTTTTDGSVTIIPTLRKLFGEPTSGVFTYETTREVETIIYDEEGNERTEIAEVPETKFQIIERRNGHITEYNSLDLAYEKISNTSIARVREALVGNEGYLFRYLAEYSEDIITFLASFEEVITIIDEQEVVTQTLTGNFLPENISSIALSPDNNSIAYLVPSNSGGTLYTTPLSSFTPTQIATIPLSEVEIIWSKANTFLLYTKPDSRAAGHLFTINSAGELQTVLDNLYGLSVLPSPSGDDVFISFSLQNDVISGVVNISDGTTSDITGVRTVAKDKCVWSNTDENTLYCAGTRASIRGSLPEDWYQGSLFFVDVLWKISAETGQAEIVSYLDEDGVSVPFDLTNLTLSANDSYLMFINKYDRAAWVLNLDTVLGVGDGESDIE